MSHNGRGGRHNQAIVSVNNYRPTEEDIRIFRESQQRQDDYDSSPSDTEWGLQEGQDVIVRTLSYRDMKISEL